MLALGVWFSYPAWALAASFPHIDHVWITTAYPTSSDIFQSYFERSKPTLVGLFCNVSMKRTLLALASSFVSGFGKCHCRYKLVTPKYSVEWISLRIRICSKNTEPCLNSTGLYPAWKDVARRLINPRSAFHLPKTTPVCSLGGETRMIQMREVRSFYIQMKESVHSFLSLLLTLSNTWQCEYQHSQCVSSHGEVAWFKLTHWFAPGTNAARCQRLSTWSKAGRPKRMTMWVSA